MATLVRTLILAVVLASVPGGAQLRLRGQEAQPDCAAPAYRQFDFWLGEWDVFTPAGTRAGRNRIVSVSDGCALVEHWEGAKGGRGTSLNAWSAADGQWRQLWVDAQGGHLDLRGGWDADRQTMTLAGSARSSDGHPIRHEISWTREADGSVRQRWRQSRDDGATWTTAFEGIYRRTGG